MQLVRTMVRGKPMVGLCQEIAGSQGTRKLFAALQDLVVSRGKQGTAFFAPVDPDAAIETLTIDDLPPDLQTPVVFDLLHEYRISRAGLGPRKPT